MLNYQYDIIYCLLLCYCANLLIVYCVIFLQPTSHVLPCNSRVPMDVAFPSTGDVTMMMTVLMAQMRETIVVRILSISMIIMLLWLLCDV